MGKRGRSKRHRHIETTRDSKRKTTDSDQDIDPHAEGFYRDEVDEFHAQKEKILLERSAYLEPASSTDEEGEEEVLGLQLSEEESGGEEKDEEMEVEEEEEDEDEGLKLPPDLRRYYASDEEEEEEDEPPELSDRAWGRSRKTFYSTDYIDDELGGSEEEKEAEEEEREALALQQRMVAALDEQDFELPEIMAEVGDEVTKGEEEKVIQDLSKLSRQEKLTLLEKDSPELFELMEEFQDKFTAVVDTLCPLIEAARRDSKVFTAQGRSYLELKFHLYLCYCLNIMFYLRLKSCNTPVQSHPVISRIVQIRQLIGQLEPLDKKLEPQLKEALEVVSGKTTVSTSVTGKNAKKTLGKQPRKRKHFLANGDTKRPKKLSQVLENHDGCDVSVEEEELHETVSEVASGSGLKEDPLKYYERIKAEKRERKKARKEAWREKVEKGEAKEDEAMEEEEEGGKRAITYQIARNKGLAPKRKKEQRNPRVRHRNKYKKALIKRKSQVLPVVTEMERYGGERTGIRANLTRSIKIK